MSQTASADQTSLKTMLRQPEIVLASGVYDALTALLATDAGFRALYLSGASIAYTRLGRPDIGLVTLTEVVETLSLIRDRVATPLIVDADTGYGNALNVQRTVRQFERAGASAIQLEDQTFPKRCGHLQDKGLIAAAEMVGKIKAAVDARASDRDSGDRAHRCGGGGGFRPGHRTGRTICRCQARMCCSSRCCAQRAGRMLLAIARKLGDRLHL